MILRLVYILLALNIVSVLSIPVTNSMTPELIASISGGLAGVIIAIGSIIASVASIISARRGAKVLEKTEAIEKVTNGHATALQNKIDSLEKALVESIADRVAAALVAKQSAADVQSALNTTPTKIE